MNPSLVVRMIKSCEALERQARIVVDRHANNPTALGRGTCRVLESMEAGIGQLRRALQGEVALVLAGLSEVTTEEERTLPRLSEILTAPENRLRSWSEIGEMLALEGFADGYGRAFKRDRLVLLGIAAGGGQRYALGTRIDNAHDDGRLFDLLNLPREVGGRGGLAPIVRSCFDGSSKYEMTWRFATPKDCLTAQIVDDDIDENENEDGEDNDEEV